MIVQRVESISPGAMSSGARLSYDVGLADSAPLVLVGIIRQGSGSANGTMSLWRPSESGQREAVFEGVPQDSRLFDPTLAGGRVLWGVPVMPGRPLQVIFSASGSVSAEVWHFLFAALDSGTRVRTPPLPTPPGGGSGGVRPLPTGGPLASGGGMVTL